MNKIKAVIFDLDDTLYPEREFVLSGFWEIAEYLKKGYGLGKSKVFSFLKSDFENGVRGKNFNRLIIENNLPKKELKKMIRIYHAHKPKIKPYSDAEKILKYIKKNRRLKTAIISDGPVEVQENKIKALKIKSYFNVIILSDRLGKKYRKPHAQPFKAALKRLKLKPKEAIYIGDNPKKDFIGAKKLGMATVRIKRGCGEYDYLGTNHNAKYEISSLLQLKEILKND